MIWIFLLKTGMEVEAEAENRGSKVLKNRGVIQKTKDLETYVICKTLKWK